MTVPAGCEYAVPHRQPSTPDREPREILVLKPSSLGDVVHALPAVALVKRRWPEARLRWLINPEWAPLLAGNPYVDETVIFPRQKLRGGRGLFRLVPWACGLRTRIRADLVVDFQGLLRSALIARLCLAAGGRIVGLSDSREGAGFFYHHQAEVRGIDHAVDRYLALVRALGNPATQPLEWPLPAGQRPGRISKNPRILSFCTLSLAVPASLSRLPMSRRSAAPSLRLASSSRVAVKKPCRPLDNVENLLNRTTLAELIWLIRRAAFVVSVDSGPMHIAAALTPRLLAIHTWSDPRKVGPYQPEAWIWKDGKLFQAGQQSRRRHDRRAASSRHREHRGVPPHAGVDYLNNTSAKPSFATREFFIPPRSFRP